MGGTGKIVSELEKLMIRNKINIIKNTDVDKILVSNKKATGIKLSDGEVIHADAVICNADPPTVYKEMLDSKYNSCLLYTSPSPRDATLSRMPSSA